MKCPYNIKVCTKCKRILVACEINFRKSKKGKWGLESRCKECCKQYYKDNREQILEQQKQYKGEHKEELKKQNKQYYEDNKESILEKNKIYREEHKEEMKKCKKEYYDKKENKEKKKEYDKIYREEHKEEIKKCKKEWYENNPHKALNFSSKRRQLEENQGNGITKEQWLEMMNYFNWCCAYSGEYIGGDSKHRTIDHIIPLSKGGLNEIWNCIPCYSSYNYSKHIKNMEQWYRQQEYFSEERLAKIYAWIEYAYNSYKIENI